MFYVSLLKKAQFNKKKSQNSTYETNDIFIEKNEISKKFYDVAKFLNSKIFQINKMFDKLYNELKFYYLIK